MTDALGSSVALADGSGGVQTEYTYEPFGATTQSGTGSTNPARYTGREEDGTGLYYYRARYYDPRRQRFTSEDQLGFGGGDVNLYAYVGSSPTNFSDPSGNIGPAAALLLGCALGAGATAGADLMAGRKINWPLAGAGCMAGGLGGFFGAGGAAAAGAAGAGAGAAAGGGAGAAGAAAGASGLGAALAAGLRAAFSRGGEYGTDGGLEYTGHAIRQMLNRGVSPERSQTGTSGRSSDLRKCGRSNGFNARRRNVTDRQRHCRYNRRQSCHHGYQHRAGAVEMSRAIIDRLAEILVRHDPIQFYLAEHANEDEYMPEAADIAEVLGSCTSRESCLELIYLCFVRNFGASVAGNPDRYAAVAAEIWELRTLL